MLANQREDELEALQALVASAGWRIFCARVEAQWGDGAALQGIRAALGTLPRGDEAAERSTAAQILAAQKQVLVLRDWPAQRIAELERTAIEAETLARTNGRPRFHRHGIGTDISGERT